jgi:diguanylate cyclase (GGDEF)-like protein
VSLASALARIAELQQVAMLDELTRVGNRRMALSRLQLAYHEWKEHAVPFGVLLLDIDNFKQCNDQYGHDVGDRIIQMVARSLSNGLRPYDFIGRWGGEEFLIILSNMRPGNLASMAERLRMLVELSNFPLEVNGNGSSARVQVTVSIGAGLIQENEDHFELVKRADRLDVPEQSGRTKPRIHINWRAVAEEGNGCDLWSYPIF